MFEIGDKVTSEKFGEGVIVEINDKLDYPVLVKFTKSLDIKGFTKLGLYRKSKNHFIFIRLAKKQRKH